jgi:hydroxymethylglutaryl-CoA synthase
MAGIVSYGAYIPKYRLSRDMIARAWRSGSMGGEKAVASYDEDSITLAVDAALNCLGDLDPKKIDGLYFACTTPPYKEKQSASLIATAVDLRRDVITTDFSDSLRAGASALKAAFDAIESQSAKQILVTTADCRMGAAQSDYEQILGDGAAAFLLGNSNTIADLMASQAISDEFTDTWRMEDDKYVKSWEDRFANIYGYTSAVQSAVDALFKKYSLKPADFAKLVLYAPNGRQQADMAKKLGFDVKTQLVDSLFSIVGNTGAALAPMMLAAALEESKPGDKILVVSYGDGAQALVFQVTPDIANMKNHRTVKNYIASRTLLPTYENYVQFRKLMVTEESRVFPSPSSVPLFWRDKKSFYSFYGSRCKKCGLIQHPVQRICYTCQSKDEFEEVKLARKGRIFTYAEDYLADVPVLPQISASVDLEDGARVFLRLTEAEAQNPADPPQKVGMPVEVAFRKLSDTSGFRSYYWKARPSR